jgi:type II restriction/modification system DNA methylase subunit YeeA
MEIKELKPRKALNKAFLKVKPNRTEIEGFKTNLITLLDRTNDTESEEFHKNLVSDFLKDTYYKQNHFINTKGRNDLVIHNGQNANSTVGVILEAKKPTNKSEMMTTDKLNVKAFQELVLYYLRERITHKNLEVKHLAVTNINEWFIFDATLFDRLFAQNKNLVKQFTDFEEGRLVGTKTDFFYKQIAEPFIADITSEIEFTYFNIQDYQKPLRNADKADDNSLIALFKLLSPEHLLKLPFTNDSNSLDKRFYSELLHIIGLTETKEGSKKLIERNKSGHRNTGTLLEDAIIQLDSLDKISRLARPSQYGSTNPERLFNVGLELSITWINRILFLKLMEAQLITYHKGDKSYSFLNLDKIKSYDDLNSLFFQVLARKAEDRNEDVIKLFEKVPYLNSSLFEPTEMEQDTIFISNLRDDKTIPIISSTVLKNEQGKKRTGSLTTLHYLFEFLDSYDFSSEGSEDIQEENKSLINASVLGLIFEKINGYKDGSFFTPGFITMYMSRETLRKAVVQKFNKAKGWSCKSFEELKEDISEEIKLGNRKSVRKRANEIINSLKIVDPAVGSGHFLVSVLNELIAIKSELRILVDTDFEPINNYTVEVVNDELIIYDEDGILYQYNYNNKESQRIQETIFHEKQTIIENCLFGVDINPNSVKICRLRLWIELLKNAYYLPTGQVGKNPTELETLPNIDINIKCGNSLVSRFDIDADIKQALKKSKWSIDSYRIAVDTYRNAESKEQKREMERLIADIKSDFRSEISLNDPKVKRLRKLSGELFQMTNQGQIFEMSKKEKADWNKKVLQLTEESKKLENEIEEIKSNKIFENAFEWRFEFPEVLNDDGDFVGFDVVIGNPPYIRQEELAEIKPFLEQNFKSFTGTADLFVYFIELGLNVLKQEGDFIFIVPNKWMKAGYGKKIREIIKSNKIEKIIDFGDLPVFEEATTYPSILFLSKSKSSINFYATNITTLNFPNGINNFIEDNKIEVFIDELNNEAWTLSDTAIQQVLSKLNSKGVSLGEFVNHKMFRGILTGFNEAFIIDETTKNKLILADSNCADIIKPFLDGKDIKSYRTPINKKWLILINNGETAKAFGKIAVDSAKNKFQEKYPSVMQRLEEFKSQLNQRTDKGEYWWELRPCAYNNYFEETKIVWAETSLGNQFCIVEGGVYLNKTSFMMPSNDLALLAILNSTLVKFYLNAIVSKVRGGYFSMSKTYVETVPIVYPKHTFPFIEKVNKIIEIKKENPLADTVDLENQIDQLVYQLYELTEEEIKIVVKN